MKTAVIYARYSSDKQTEQSIEGQLRVCYEFAERNDYKILGTYIDRAISGKTDNRAEFQKMLKDSNRQIWDAVLVYKLDRFSRNKYEMAIHKKTLRNNDVKLVSAMENIPDSPEGILIESLLEGMAEYYSVELAQKVKRGMKETRRKGNFTGGVLLYGFKKEGKKVIVDEEKAKVVRYIFEQYASGVYVKDIISDLAERGITFNGKPFARTTIYTMLKSEKYSGVYHYEGEKYTNIYPQIVPEELFNIVREKTQANAYGKHDNRFVYLLKNKVVCGYCGSSVVASTGTSGSGIVNRYYKCRRRVQNKNNCNQNSIRKDDLEEIVIQVMNKALTNNNIITIANEVTTRIRNTNEGQVVLKLLEKDRNKVQREIDNMLKLMGQGICTKSTKQRLIELENQIDTLNDKIIEEKAKEKMQLTDDEIIAFVKKALKKAPRLLLQTLIKKVVLYEDKIEIYFNYTDRTIDEPDDSQDFLFYQEEQAREVHIVRYPKATTDIKKWQVYCLV